MLGDVKVDCEQNVIIKDGIAKSIEPRLMRVIVLLSRSMGKLVTRQVLLQEISELAYASDESLTQAISKIRQLLGDSPREPEFIKTIPKKGYILLCPVSEVPNTFDNKGLKTQIVPARKPPKAFFKAKYIVISIVLFFLIVLLSVGFFIFSPEESHFLEKGDTEFIEKGDVEFIEKDQDK
jgi:DNA-binding winged helix-turn-helix (wHTH) protein